MRNIIIFVIAWAFALVMLGCGGGGSDPISQIPQAQNPQYEYRLYVLDFPDGGQIITSLNAHQGVNTPFEVRYDWRIKGQPNWAPVAQESTLDVTIEGAPSGHKMPDIGLSGGQYRIRTGTCRIEFFPPVGGQLGSTFLVLKVRESGAPQVRVSITILAKSGDNPGGQSCRDLHPTKEAIDGYWWDCVNGDWQNTGVPVNPPPPPVTYSLHIYGAQGEFVEGGTISIDEGNGYQLQIWELSGSDGSKVTLDGSNATMESSVLPFWCWDDVRREIMTVLWVSPDYPDPAEPGNIFINPGQYDISFEVAYGGKVYHRSGNLLVIERPDFP